MEVVLLLVVVVVVVWEMHNYQHSGPMQYTQTTQCCSQSPRPMQGRTVKTPQDTHPQILSLFPSLSHTHVLLNPTKNPTSTLSIRLRPRS